MTSDGAQSTLRRGLERLGFSTEKVEFLLLKMDLYIRELILFNSAYNLTNTSDYGELAVFHVLDSLSAVGELTRLAQTLNTEDGARLKIADIGSGGGLPGIPLAAALPQFNFSLVERMDKRCSFLENECALLGLKNARVVRMEAEKAEPESFDIAVFRAFRPLDKKMIKTLLAAVKRGGFLAAYKAKAQSIAAELAGIADIVSDYRVAPLSVPFLDGRERNLVVIRKE
ncbi:MAG: 16S rRNA (guanine(527)-N(7))-methyltransferase RsmG [Treponema sp.]